MKGGTSAREGSCYQKPKKLPLAKKKYSKATWKYHFSSMHQKCLILNNRNI